MIRIKKVTRTSVNILIPAVPIDSAIKNETARKHTVATDIIPPNPSVLTNFRYVFIVPDAFSIFAEYRSTGFNYKMKLFLPGKIAF